MMTVIDDCEWDINVKINFIVFHFKAIASGVVYMLLGAILLILYTCVSKTLIKGIKMVRLIIIMRIFNEQKKLNSIKTRGCFLIPNVLKQLKNKTIFFEENKENN